MSARLELDTFQGGIHPPKGAPFESSVRIYYEDTDAQGVVYYANYLKFMERCRTDWLRSIGCDISIVSRQFGLVFAVRSTHVEYFKPARLSDLLTVTVDLEELKRASIRLQQLVYRGKDLLCRGTIRLACLDASGFEPVAIPEPLISEIKKWKMP